VVENGECAFSGVGSFKYRKLSWLKRRGRDGLIFFCCQCW
jgi:hypothetical protein